MTNVSSASRIYRCARAQSLRILTVVVIIPFTLTLLLTAAHVTRVLILVTTTAPLFRLAKRLSAKSA
jgi:uncharacterized membrane protein AbrB (regulator of aidB expression)